jgi:MinD-like ATPase involved in chromosome partitioning or flagellar assembly
LDLPTYTNIWRIEKRLYKLYDFRLPMPLPVGQIAVFTAIAVPYVVVLKLVGLPFSHTLLWLYILPPGALAWLVTRPVLEGKRLPELVVSQLRYLNEPRTWCRMAPLAERDQIVVVARVWRRADGAMTDDVPVVTSQPAAVEAVEAVDVAAGPLAPPSQAASQRPALERHLPDRPITAWPQAPAEARSALPTLPNPPAVAPAVRQVAGQPGRAVPVPPVREGPGQPARAVPVPPVRQGPGQPGRAEPGPPVREGPGQPGRAVPGPPARDVPDRAAAQQAPPASPPRPRPLVTVTGDQPGERPIRTVERVLGSPSERRTAGWHDHVVVVPGGHRPGRPDQLQRDRARARLPIPAGRRVVVLGCTVGAGQSMTTLLTGELLASLRDDPVAALDLNPGRGSLAERAQAVPALTGSAPPAPSRLEVVTREAAAAGEADEEDVTKIFELLSARYPLTLADPGAAAVPRVLAAANQLILVAPASQDAASALATTREWLEAHGHAQLADEAITVLNGVSRHTLPHVEQAEALARGRCRAIVRVPWDDHLKDREPERAAPPAPGAPGPKPVAGSLSPAALHAYTALAGVLVAALASAPEQVRARP